MPRIRTLKPELASDVKLASVSRDARYTFILLITQSDDEGLIAGAHRQLLGALYPHDDAVTTVDLLRWVEELVTIGLLRWRATTDGAPVLEITNWSKHQRVDNKGRSQLAHLLAPVTEVRGDPPRVAEDRGLEVGSRTNDQGPTTKEVGAAPIDIAKAFVTEHDFGPCAGSVEGLIRASKSPAAVIATLRMHLLGELSHEKATPIQLGLACQQFIANGNEFNARHFAGFIVGAKRGAEKTENRKRNTAEAQSIDAEMRSREKAAKEARVAQEALENFEANEPERFAELRKRAEATVPRNITFGRDEIVRGALLSLIRDERAA